MIKTLPNPATDLLNRACSCFHHGLEAKSCRYVMLHAFDKNGLNICNNICNNLGMVVIGAGLRRTGLTSLRVALGQLLREPCHHAADLADGDSQVLDFWVRAIDGKNTKADWRNYFEGRGYRACVDNPALLFWKYVPNLACNYCCTVIETSGK